MTTPRRYVRVTGFTFPYADGRLCRIYNWTCSACGRKSFVALAMPAQTINADQHSRECPAVRAAMERDYCQHAYAELKARLTAENARLTRELEQAYQRMWAALDAVDETTERPET